MGCISSKLMKKQVKKEGVVLLLGNNNNNNHNHVVSLTSSTYGALQLDHRHQHQQQQQQSPSLAPAPVPPVGISSPLQINKNNGGIQNHSPSPPPPPPPPEPEVINTWELMSDLEDNVPPTPTSTSTSSSSSSKSKNQKKINKKKKKKEMRSPFKTLTNPTFNSPKPKPKSPIVTNSVVSGKENIVINNCYTTPKAPLFNPFKRPSTHGHSTDRFASPRTSSSSSSSSVSVSRRRKSLGPLFDPDMINSFEKELCEEKCKCPPGGQHCVVIYTTTLRGIRKTFEDCNAVRAILESYHIRLIERDISMDSGFKEELRKLMGGSKEFNVPLVFVKGKLIGGASEVVRLDEEGKLQGLLQGIPMAVFGCQGCGGIRFVMCLHCNGSCKLSDRRDRKSLIRCPHCNENGLIQCPICCSSLN